jgi:hypothetical protein
MRLNEVVCSRRLACASNVSEKPGVRAGGWEYGSIGVNDSRFSTKLCLGCLG